MNKLLYISTGLPKDEVDKLQKKQFNFSSNALLPLSVFHGNIMSGLANVYDEICSLCGVPISHKNYKVFRFSSRNFRRGNIHYVIPAFFNLPGIKQFTTSAKLCFHILNWCFKNRAHTRHILIDGAFYTGLIPLLVASKIAKVKIGAITVDYYNFMDPKGNSLSQRLYRKLMGSVDYFVFVTDHLAKLINQDQKPYMIMEGLVNVPSEDIPAVQPGDYCMYAGGLHSIYGLQNLVDAFHQTDLPYSLYLYGNGDLVDYIREIGKKDNRIVYKGILSHEELLQVERSAKLLINPRPVYGELDTRFNFPSKLMEYMQSGRPVITTKLLGIPEEYENYMFFFEEDTVEGIREGIQRTLSQDENTLAAFGQKAKDYVNENKNNIALGKKIFSLMNTHMEE